MSGFHEIKAHIASVRSIQQITRAMYLISATRAKKAKVQLENTMPYFNRVAITLSEILAAGYVDTYYLDRRNLDYTKRRPGKQLKKLYLVIAGDKGMAGAYNHNIVSLLESEVDKERSTLMVVGFMGRNIIGGLGYDMDQEFRYPVMDPSLYRARDISEILIEKYLSGEYYQVDIVFTEMISSMKQSPVIVQLLPLKPSDLLKCFEQGVLSHINIVKYEPSPRVVFDQLAPHYIKGVVYGALVEAFSSEQQARMIAMDESNRSADELISSLSLLSNRARQASITQEISEIVGGMPEL